MYSTILHSIILLARGHKVANFDLNSLVSEASSNRHGIPYLAQSDGKLFVSVCSTLLVFFFCKETT